MNSLLRTSFDCMQCNQQRSIAELVACTKCSGDTDDQRYFCARYCVEDECGQRLDCDARGHRTCWDSHLPNLRQREKLAQHGQYAAADDISARLILYSEVDDAVQAELHQRDQQREWFRVTLARPTIYGDKPTLQVSNRFREVCKVGRQGVQQYPSFVSFVGDTGAGKSTTVRAMIMVAAIEEIKERQKLSGQPLTFDLQELVDCLKDGPVTRSGNPDHASSPTSVGVHLYADVNSTDVVSATGQESENVSLLFADCEGFRGGTMATNAQSEIEQLARSLSGLDCGELIDPIQAHLGGMDRHVAIKDCEITAPDFSLAGKQSAELFYARFLYAFSDVVVFLTPETQQLNADMQRLLEWSVSAVKKSVARGSPKTLLVVVNGPKMHDDEWYDPARLKRKMFQKFGNLWEHSPELTKFKRDHDDIQQNNEDKIHDNDDLFKQFFSETKMCYIPRKDKASASVIYRQYRQLRDLLVEGSQEAQRSRSKSWTRYNVPSLSRLLDRAFDHFANSTDPFDFHKAAKRDNPTPISMSAHVANFLRHCYRSNDTLERFSDIVASCLVTYAVRNYQLARAPEEIFREDLKSKCEDALRIFRDKFQQCAGQSRGTSCTRTKYDHASHFDGTATTWDGEFDTRGFPWSHEKMMQKLHDGFCDLFNEVYDCAQHDLPEEVQRMLQTTRRTILGMKRADFDAKLRIVQFNEQVEPGNFPRSNRSCFACLQDAPDHVLRCSHALCAKCVKDFGITHETRRHCYVLQGCPLCGTGFGDLTSAQIFQLDPPFAGARLLTLDGGGIRGIIELAILQKIEQRIGIAIPIRHFFDLMVGTSTGGIISLALALTGSEKSLADLKQDFVTFGKEIFQVDRISRLDKLDILPHAQVARLLMLLKWIESRYDNERMKQSLTQIFPPDRPIFGPVWPGHEERTTRVTVTSTSNGYSCSFSNYTRYSFDRNAAIDKQAVERDNLVIDEGLQRADDPDQETKIWEAAMATAAAPSYFPPWRSSGNREFVDGALHSNLPVTFAHDEFGRIWPKEINPKRMDLLVSIGTGNHKSDFKMPKWIDIAGAGQVALYFRNIIDTGKLWDNFRSSQVYRSDVHHRLNIDLEQKIELDDWSKMEELIKAVDYAYAKGSNHPSRPPSLYDQVEDVSYLLVAGLFYYEPIRLGTFQDKKYCTGYIWCRLETPSAAFESLMARVDGFFIQYGSKHSTNALAMHASWNSIKQDSLSTDKQFELPCNIVRGEDSSESIVLYVKLQSVEKQGTSRLVRMSGFPTTFEQVQRVVKLRSL